MSNERTATLRTAWGTTVMTYLVILLNWAFDWDITIADLTPWAPAIFVVVGILYRLMLLLVKWQPWIGYVLFGSIDKPQYDTGTGSGGNDRGEVGVGTYLAAAGCFLVVLLVIIWA